MICELLLPPPLYPFGQVSSILTDLPLVEAKDKVAEAAGMDTAEAKAKAQELAGEAKGKAEELKGEAKGKAAEVKGEAKAKM
jgi:regulator of protease activity HflC (stomatin/prohibitin superfamily)